MPRPLLKQYSPLAAVRSIATSGFARRIRENVRVFVFECSELVLGYRLVAGEEVPVQKGHVGSQDYEDNALHIATSFLVLERPNDLRLSGARKRVR